MNKKISILPIVFALVTSTYAQKIKIGTYVFKDGAQYSGELMNGKPYECVDYGFEKNENVDVVLRPEDIDIVAPEDGKIVGTVNNS